MENNLYYTPTIEEFHVGFEFEMENLIIEPSDGSYIKCIYGEYNMAPERFKSLLNHYKSIRVKYLDQSDIESLGWLDGELRGMTPFIFNELDPDNEFQLYYQFDNQFAQIYNCHAQFVFQGIIKNKSELIKLMQQLNIK